MRKLIAALFVFVLFAMPAAAQTSVMMQFQSEVGEPTALSRSLGVDVTHRVTNQGETGPGHEGAPVGRG